MNNYTINTFLSKIYIWGIIFEPQLYFIILSATVLGFNLTLAKIFEILLILFIVIFSFLSLIEKGKFKLKLPEINSIIYVFIYLFILSMMASFLIGYFYDGFDINLSNYQRGDFYNYQLDQKIIMDGLMGIFTISFYFLFFSIFSISFLDTSERLKYFFDRFKKLFLFFLIVGFIDYMMAVVTTSDIDLLSRHLFDEVNVGERFHSTGGEPRHAAIYLFFGLAVFNLESFVFKKKNNKLLFFTTLLAVLMTQSVTVLIALFIYIFLMFFIFIFELGIKRLVQFTVVMTVSLLMGFIVFNNAVFFSTYIDRLPILIRYMEAFSDIWFILESEAELPYYIKVQLGEVFPIYDLIKMIQNGEFVRVIFGSGPGSAALNNYSYIDILDAYGNPNAQGIRLLYESGILGSCIYLLAFFFPVGMLTSSYDKQTRLSFYNYMALIVACCLALRSPVAYIYLGLFIASFKVIANEKLHKGQLE